MAVVPLAQVTRADPLVRAAALGVVRGTRALPAYDLQLLLDAMTRPQLLPNPNASPGCSPILRAYLVQTGIPFTVRRELANDGGRTGHSTGNALDIGTPATDNVQAALDELASAALTFPALFTRIVHLNPDMPSRTAMYGPVDNDLLASSQTSIHIESTPQQVRLALTSPNFTAQRAAVLTVLTDQTAFGNRDVHFNTDTVTHDSRANSCPAERPVVNFW